MTKSNPTTSERESNKRQMSLSYDFYSQQMFVFKQ